VVLDPNHQTLEIITWLVPTLLFIFAMPRIAQLGARVAQKLFKGLG